MKKIIILSLCLIAGIYTSTAQDTGEEMKYRRSSIYSIMVKHDNQKFADTIASVFKVMPVPDKYNDHDLSVKVISTTNKDNVSEASVKSFLEDNGVASRLVSKWFNRDFTTGVCDVELVRERGLYSASERDKAIAHQSVRGDAMLEDAGMELINNTFVLVNDIHYIDQAKKGAGWGAFLKIAGSIAAQYTGNSSWEDIGNSAGTIAETYKGFKVKILTHLYQLVWDDESEAIFYNQIWADAPDETKRSAMNLYRDKFKLKYIGTQESDGSNTSFLGINEDEPRLMVRKACQRALDDNVMNLQKNFDQFKVKVPLLSVEPITAQIGLKEGITEKSKFEVLEVRVKNGKTEYHRVGTLKPDDNLIWDNRFMAVEEGAANATLGFTTFKKVSGGNFYPGMLIREIK